jgi:hypothetical protein
MRVRRSVARRLVQNAAIIAFHTSRASKVYRIVEAGI